MDAQTELSLKKKFKKSIGKTRYESLKMANFSIFSQNVHFYPTLEFFYELMKELRDMFSKKNNPLAMIFQSMYETAGKIKYKVLCKRV